MAAWKAGWMDRRLDEWMDDGMNGWKNRRMEKWMAGWIG